MVRTERERRSAISRFDSPRWKEIEDLAFGLDELGVGYPERGTATHLVRATEEMTMNQIPSLRRLALLAVLALASCGGPSAPPPSKPSARPPITAVAPIPAPRFTPRVGKDLLPRSVIFNDPERTAPRMSPDGKLIGFGATKDNHSSLFVGPLDDLEKAKPIHIKTAGHIKTWFFAYAPNYFLYVLDTQGRENFRPYALTLDKQETVDLTPPDHVMAEIQGVSARRPFEVAVAASTKNGEAADLFVVDIRTGKSKRIFENKERFVDFDLDADYVPQIGTRVTATGEKEIRRLMADGSSTLLFKLGLQDQLTTSTIGLADSGKTLYLRDTRDRETMALVAVDLATNTSTVVASDPKADIVSVMRDPKTGKPQAYSSDPGKRAWHPIDPAVASDLSFLSDEHHVIDIVSRTTDDTQWIVMVRAPNEPTRWMLYDRKKREKKLLFIDRPELGKYPLASMDVIHVTTRDGLDLVGYLTLPSTPGPSPLVLWVHGGPWDRDQWELNPFFQVLANRGYAVLSVNFRGSTGFGKKLVNAGDREWGGKMQDDLLDAVSWAVEKKIADPTRVAIFGGSYGGYATLVGLSRDPDRFACGIDLVGPSNLVTFVESIPALWRPLLGQFHARVGDPSTAEGKRTLLERSPLTRASSIDKPVLVVQGKNDPRVKERESSQMVDALVARKVPVTYLLYDDEGHGFGRDENIRSFTAVAEVFLSQCLGGTYEPFGNALVGSSMRAIVGGELISGLAAAALAK